MALVFAAPGNAAAEEPSAVAAELQKRIVPCWSLPPVAADVGTARITIRLTRDGELAAPPSVERSLGQGVGFEILAKSAVRAILRCSPYPSLAGLAPYQDWKTVVINFSAPAM